MSLSDLINNKTDQNDIDMKETTTNEDEKSNLEKPPIDEKPDVATAPVVENNKPVTHNRKSQ
ncbi:unnamed protein product, partial [Rotaria magnacalcarata]